MHTPPVQLAACAALGLVAVLLQLPAAHLLGYGAFWQHGDPGAHSSALHLYLSDVWHWPPLFTTALNYPEGINIAFADVIPLMALPMKALGVSPETPGRFFGGWVILAFCLQGLSAGVLLRSAGLRSLPLLLVGAAFFTLSPSMMFRVNAHTALTSHFLLLLALAVLIKQHRNPAKARSGLLGVPLLIVVALAIHPYLAAMALAICLTGFTQPYLWRMHPGSCGLSLLATLGLPAAYLLLMGYLDGGLGGSSGTGGFDINSMNLVAPLAGGAFPLWQGLEDPTGRFGALPMPFDATGGQYEGYNHLGLGVMALLPVALIVQRTSLLRIIVRYWRVILLMLGFTAYALSTTAHAFESVLYTVTPPEWTQGLLGQFRSSGRFFWPVGYALLMVAVAGVALGQAPTTLKLLVLGGALMLQVVDTQPLRKITREVTSETAAPFALKDDRVLTAISKANTIYLLPSFGCGARAFEDVVTIQVEAAASGASFNTGLIARGYSDCGDKEEVLSQPLQPDATYIVFLDSPRSAPLAALLLNRARSRACFDAAPYLVCSRSTQAFEAISISDATDE